ncbi:hypothetical protein KEM52_005236 [Ascosphaera acerosa]|nr:hypothetical protein KEM52_005236 [Ascosphaera acerosa]
MAPPTAINTPAAPNAPFFTPHQTPPAGTAANPQSDGRPVPKLFTPLKIKGLTFPNRVWLAPLCQYSAEDGHMTDWHLVHLGAVATRGVGMVIAEATAVQAEGRISPQCPGLWKDSQIAPLKRVTDYVHSQGQLIGVQLAHAGRKSSTNVPWLPNEVASAAAGGWPDEVYGPSELAWPAYGQPKAMTAADIARCKDAFAAAATRAVAAGCDFVQIHAAHGYLLSSFLNPRINTRADEYGGSFEGRIRLVLEVVERVRAALPADMPLMLRVSGSDFMEHLPAGEPRWGVEETRKFAKALADQGLVDLLDVSGGGVLPNASNPKYEPGYQVHLAAAAKEAAGDKLLVSTVGAITEGKFANEVLEKHGLDGVFVGRALQKNPGLAWQMADDLGLEIKQAYQYSWPYGGRAAGPHAFIKAKPATS